MILGIVASTFFLNNVLPVLKSVQKTLITNPISKKYVLFMYAYTHTLHAYMHARTHTYTNTHTLRLCV